MAEAESVSARKATLLNPTEEDETAQVLRRRLFASIDEDAAREAVAAYQAVWSARRDAIADDAGRPETAARFRTSWPLHPEVLQTLTAKTATLETFQRVRGMLRLLARAIAHLWEVRPADATAIHLHHVDPGCEPIRQEIVTRLQQSRYLPAIANDVAGTGGTRALAQDLDAKHHGGLPPYAAYAARTIFMHTLAFNEALKGLSPEQLRYSMLGPASDVSFIEEARKKFVLESAYLDDRPGAPMRFLAEANLTQIIRREEQNVDSGDARTELNDRIGEIFKGGTFDAIRFPGGPFDVPDDVGGGRPKLVVLAYDAVTIGTAEEVPDLVRRIYVRKGSDGSALRLLRNHVVFVVADEARKAEMRRHASRRLALRELKKPERLAQLAEHQRDKVRELEARSEQELALAVQQCYRHVFYPSRHRVESADVDLAHSAIDTHSASDQPGAGQRHIARQLADLNKLRHPRGRARFAGLRARPDAPQEGRDHDPGPAQRVPARPGPADADRRRRVRPRRPAGRRTGRVRLPAGRSAARSRGSVGGDRDRRAVRHLHDGVRPESGHLAAAGAGTPGVSGIGGVGPRGGGVGGADGSAGASFTRTTGSSSAREGDEPPYGAEPPSEALSAEGVLNDALTQIWEQARGRGIERLGALTIRMFEAGDAFRLLGSVGGVRGAEKAVSFVGGYETRDGGSFQIEFRGPVTDAQPVREFLEPQLRDASTRNLEASFELTFADGLSMAGDAAETFTERLSRFAGGAAYVSATAQAAES